jgi:hypothetical protein
VPERVRIEKIIFGQFSVHSEGYLFSSGERGLFIAAASVQHVFISDEQSIQFFTLDFHHYLFRFLNNERVTIAEYLSQVDLKNHISF